MNNRPYDEDLEIPPIDGLDRRDNKKNLEETDASGIPLFLKGQEIGNRKTSDKNEDISEFLRGDNQATKVIDEEELPDFLTGGSTETDIATKVAPAVLSEMEEEPQPLPSFEPEKKKSSTAGTIILSILIFVVLTAVLLFVGIKVVDHYAPKPSIAPLEPVTTVTPEAIPTASAVSE